MQIFRLVNNNSTLCSDYLYIVVVKKILSGFRFDDQILGDHDHPLEALQEQTREDGGMLVLVEALQVADFIGREV